MLTCTFLLGSNAPVSMQSHSLRADVCIRRFRHNRGTEPRWGFSHSLILLFLEMFVGSLSAFGSHRNALIRIGRSPIMSTRSAFLVLNGSWTAFLTKLAGKSSLAVGGAKPNKRATVAPPCSKYKLGALKDKLKKKLLGCAASISTKGCAGLSSSASSSKPAATPSELAIGGSSSSNSLAAPFSWTFDPPDLKQYDSGSDNERDHLLGGCSAMQTRGGVQPARTVSVGSIESAAYFESEWRLTAACQDVFLGASPKLWARRAVACATLARGMKESWLARLCSWRAKEQRVSLLFEFRSALSR